MIILNSVIFHLEKKVLKLFLCAFFQKPDVLFVIFVVVNREWIFSELKNNVLYMKMVRWRTKIQIEQNKNHNIPKYILFYCFQFFCFCFVTVQHTHKLWWTLKLQSKDLILVSYSVGGIIYAFIITRNFSLFFTHKLSPFIMYNIIYILIILLKFTNIK